jgi:hypothetical protein
MDNVIEVVALLRRHSELELQILNERGAAVAGERAGGYRTAPGRTSPGAQCRSSDGPR